MEFGASGCARQLPLEQSGFVNPRRPFEDPQQDEGALWTALLAERSMAAREVLFERYRPLARKIASQHFRDRTTGDIEFADLYQLACAGLLESLDRYDPALGAPFAGYAGRRIAGSILDGVAKTSEVREQISYRNRMRSERLRSLSPARPPVTSEDAMDALIEAAIGLALGFMLESPGLYVPEDTPEPRPNAYESLVWKEAVQNLHAQLDNLPIRERAILRQHYLEGMAFDQIAVLLDLTKGRVSQIHRAALTLLKVRLKSAGRFALER